MDNEIYRLLEILMAQRNSEKVCGRKITMDKRLEVAIEQLRQGQQQGFQILYDQTHNYVFMQARTLLKNEADVHDLVQEVYINAYRSISSLQENQKIYAWLGGIAFRQATKILRTQNEIPIGEEILRVEGLTQPGVFENVNFYVNSGEIIGFAGLMGAGRTEIMRAIFGLDPYESGTIRIEGKEVQNKNVRQSIKNGLAMLTEDRRRTGIVPILSVKFNTTLATLDKVIYRGKLHAGEENSIVKDACESMNVKTPNLEAAIGNLSGGNQQKVVLAKWLICDPKVLIADEPTRGIDVGAKREIYELMSKFAAKGKGIIMISSELPELIGICDRIYVVSEGRIAGMLSRSEFSQESIMQFAVSNVQ